MRLQLTAADLVEALKRRHPEESGEWVLVEEFRQIDAFALRCWSSGVGLRRVAYEVKRDRADFRRELIGYKPGPNAKSWRTRGSPPWPQKAQPGLDRSHQFYFAVPRGLLKPEEIASSAPTLEDNGLWVPPEAGLVEFDWPPQYEECTAEQIEELRADGEIDGRNLLGTIRRRAPVRDVPRLSERDVAVLVRWRLSPNRMRQMHVKASVAEQEAALLEERARYAEDRQAEAERRLEELLGRRVKDGAVWEGELRSLREDPPLRTRARVKRMQGHVRLEPLDVQADHGYERFMPLGRFLATWVESSEAVAGISSENEPSADSQTALAVA